MTQYSGRCLCETVRFCVTAPTKWCAHCHCSLCQRAHGSAVVTWVGVEQTQFEFSAGGDALTWFASTPGAQRGFCRHCGSTLFFRSERWPGEIHIVRSNFEGPIDREPALHVYYDSHAQWLNVNDGLPQRGGGDVDG